MLERSKSRASAMNLTSKTRSAAADGGAVVGRNPPKKTVGAQASNHWRRSSAVHSWHCLSSRAAKRCANGQPDGWPSRDRGPAHGRQYGGLVGGSRRGRATILLVRRQWVAEFSGHVIGKPGGERSEHRTAPPAEPTGCRVTPLTTLDGSTDAPVLTQIKIAASHVRSPRSLPPCRLPGLRHDPLL